MKRDGKININEFMIACSFGYKHVSFSKLFWNKKSMKMMGKNAPAWHVIYVTFNRMKSIDCVSFLPSLQSTIKHQPIIKMPSTKSGQYIYKRFCTFHSFQIKFTYIHASTSTNTWLILSTHRCHLNIIEHPSIYMYRKYMNYKYKKSSSSKRKLMIMGIKLNFICVSQNVSGIKFIAAHTK